MAQQYKDEAGNIWEMGPDGQPRFVAPAAMQTKPADPRMPYQLQQDQGQAAAAPYQAPQAQANLARTQAEAGIAQATAPAEIAQKQANARQTAAQAASAEANLAATGGANEGQSKSASFYTRANRANRLYEGTGVKDQPAGRNIALTLLPDALVNEFTSSQRQQAEAAQRDFIASTLRYESGANIPQNEFDLQKSIYFPAPGDSPQTISMKAQLRANAIDGLRVASGPAAAKLDIGNAAAPDIQPATTSLAGVLRNQTISEFDPQTSAAVDKLIRMGVPPSEIAAYAKSKGYPLGPEQLTTIGQAELYAKQNPSYKGGFTQATRGRNATVSEKIAGSPLGAFGSAAGSAATLGFNDEIAGGINALSGGNYAEGRDAFQAGKDLLGNDHPYATLAGTAAGSILPFGVAGKAIQGSRLGMFGAKSAIAGDAALGSVYGAGESNDDRFGGAVLGGLSGGAGNIAGRGLAKGVASVISPTGGPLASLYAMGVRPSVGQRFGGIVNNFEEKLKSVPFLGDAIEGTRDRARNQFQTGLFNDALGEIGHQLPEGMPVGHEPHAFAQKAFSDAYSNAESGMVAAADQQMAQDVGELQKAVGTLTESSQRRFDTIWKNAVARRLANGQLAGPAYKDAMSDLGKEIGKIRGNQSGDGELAQALEQAQGMLRSSASRNSSPEAVQAMDAVDRGYAKLVRIEDAARRRGGEAGTFSPRQYDAAVQNVEKSVRDRGYLRGDALNSDIAAKGLHLEDQVSNSGSIDRLLPSAALVGTSFISPKAASLMGVYGALNAPGVRNFTTGMFAPRGGKAKTTADFIRKYLENASGTAGAGAGLGLLGFSQ